MTREDLKKLQNTQLNILKDVVRVCNENDIKYFVMYGTLIGTVRHQGTIPWDNDIDIMMTRDEFKKFFNVRYELPNNLVVNFLDTNDIDISGEARISNINTLQYGINHQSKKGNISIDIFIFDNAKLFPSIIRNLKCKCSEFLRFMILDDFERKWLYDLHQSSKLKIAFLKLTEILGKKTSKEKVLKKIKNTFVTNEDTGYIVCCNDSDHGLLKKSDFSNSVTMKYEDLDVSVPVGYDNILRSYYGDYMQLPPEEKRFTANLDDFVVEYLDE